jgi:hypothetical protein
LSGTDQMSEPLDYAVPNPNAFTINMLSGRSFPFGISCNLKAENVFALMLFPQRLVELCDLIDPSLHLVIFELDHYFYADEWKRMLTLREVADRLDYTAYQALDDQTLVIPMDGLKRLLTEISHYNIKLFNARADATELVLIDSVTKAQDALTSRDDIILPQLSGADFFLIQHDDCYVYLESYDKSFIQRIFARTLQTYTGTMLAEDPLYSGRVISVPAELISLIWPENTGITIMREDTHVQDTDLIIGVAKRQFTFTEQQDYPVDFVIRYDFHAGSWHTDA